MPMIASSCPLKHQKLLTIITEYAEYVHRKFNFGLISKDSRRGN